MRSNVHYTRFWCTSIIILILDQLTKLWVLYTIEPGTYNYPPPIPIIPNWFYLVHIYNTGAAWGIFSGGTLWFSLLAIATIIAIYFFRHKLELNRPAVQFSIGLLTGGILGNLIDRLYRGHVIDFLDLHLPNYRWPAFNIADSAIFLGVTLYLIIIIFDSKKTKKN